MSRRAHCQEIMQKEDLSKFILRVLAGVNEQRLRFSRVC